MIRSKGLCLKNTTVKSLRKSLNQNTQENNIELIASENYVSKDILFIDGSINNAKEEASIERRAYTAFLSMQGI